MAPGVPGAPPARKSRKSAEIQLSADPACYTIGEMSIYKEKPSWSDGRQITFRDSILLFIEAIDPGNDIFEETGEIPAIPWPLERPCKKAEVVVRPVTRQFRNRSGQSYMDSARLQRVNPLRGQ